MKNRPVTFTPAAARRIASAVARVESGRNVTPGRKFTYMQDEAYYLRLCETAGDSTIGSTVTVNVVGGEPDETVDVKNIIGIIPSGKKVLIGKNLDDDVWYIVSTEMIWRDVITGVELDSDKLRFTFSRVWTLADDFVAEPIDIPVNGCEG